MKHIDIEATQRRRYETYEKEKDNLIITRIPGGYKVNNIGKASEYLVTKDHEGKIICNCKDFTNFKGAIKCKHVITVLKKATRTGNTVIKTENKNNEEVINVSNNMNNQNNNLNIPNQDDITLQEILNKPFLPEQIKYRKGYNGKQLSYIETHSAIERLNQAFNLKWSWEILDYNIEEKQVYCRGKLSVKIEGDTIVKEGFGGKARAGELGDDLKGAASDALKKASSLLGIGLHLYYNTTTPANNTPSKPVVTPMAPIAPPTTAKPQTSASIPPQKQASNESKTPGGNGKGGNGKGHTDINQIIKRW